MKWVLRVGLTAMILAIGMTPLAMAETTPTRAVGNPPVGLPAGTVYVGPKASMRFEEVAAYCAPVIWFSPDEPLLAFRDDGSFQLPLPLPFEEPTDEAVVYFRISRVVGREDAEASEFWSPASRKEDFILHLDKIDQLTIHFFFYYDRETGVGAHRHDFETTEFSVAVEPWGSGHILRVKEIIAHAHGIPWYFNVLNVEDEPDVVFPATIIVEEGKHGNCTDRNGDGFYSPGYDVNKRVNDAWGVKDVMRAGVVITPTYNTWMTKIRFKESRIAPPLPKDSPWYDRFTSHVVFAEPNKRQYTLRPVPDIRQVDFSAIEHGDNLKHFIESKGYPDWPEATEANMFGKIGEELFSEAFLGSYGYGYRYDGDNSLFAAVPLLLTRNFEVPYTGGWFIQRIYLHFKIFEGDFRLWGHQFTYTPSASRWFDWYASAGYEIRDRGMDHYTTDFVYEAGSKFRANIGMTGLRFLRYLGSDFWGARLGFRFAGFPDVKDIKYVIEVGAGVW